MSKNVVAFSSVVNRKDIFGIVGPACSRQRPFPDWTERQAPAVGGSNGLKVIQMEKFTLQIKTWVTKCLTHQ